MFSHHILHILSALLLTLPPTIARKAKHPYPDPPSHPPLGADAFACVFLPDYPPGALDLPIHFEAGSGPQCMRSTGQAANMLVNKPGTTCASIGYIEPEMAGKCETQTSMMNVSYSFVTGGGARRGMTQTWWDSVTAPLEGGEVGEGGEGEGEWVNAMKLMGPARNVVACTTQKPCRAPRGDRWSVTWKRGSKGPVYIIFKPQ